VIEQPHPFYVVQLSLGEAVPASVVMQALLLANQMSMLPKARHYGRLEMILLQALRSIENTPPRRDM